MQRIAMIVFCLLTPNLGAQQKKEDAKQPFEGHTRWVSAVAFSPDSTLLSSAGCDETVRVWEVKTGKLIQKLNLGTKGGLEDINHLAFLPNNTIVIAGGSISGPSRLHLWKRDAYQVTHLTQHDGHAQGISSLLVSPVGNILMTTDFGGEQVIIWNAEKGEIMQHFNLKLLAHHTCLAPDADRRTIYISSGKKFGVLDLPTNKVAVWGSGHRSAITCIATTKKSGAVAYASHDTITIWRNPPNGDEYTVIKGGGKCTSIVFTPDGKHLAAIRSGVLSLLNTSTFDRMDICRDAYCVSFSPDGKSIAIGGENGLAVHPMPTMIKVEPMKTAEP